MKVAIFSESPADEAAIRILVDAIRGAPTDTVPLNIRTRGWPAVLNTLPPILKYLHYRTDADALVVVVDADDSPIHEPSHETAPPTACRLCQLRAAFDTELPRLRPVQGRAPLKIAVGVAAPAMEAWLLAGLDIHVTEHARKELKRRLYGVEPAPLALETSKMVEHATRLAHDLSTLERLFPIGFGVLAEAVRKW